MVRGGREARHAHTDFGCRGLWVVIRGLRAEDLPTLTHDEYVQAVKRDSRQWIKVSELIIDVQHFADKHPGL
jgi:hypothetical protein